MRHRKIDIDRTNQRLYDGVTYLVLGYRTPRLENDLTEYKGEFEWEYVF